MEKELFDDLVQSFKEVTAFAKGEAKASPRFELTPPNVKAVRERIGLSQSEFARPMRVSVKTLPNWEQQWCHPTRPAAVPEVVMEALHASVNASRQ